MAIMPRKPFFDLERFFEDWPEWSGLATMRSPRMDVYEEGNNLVAEVEMPGVEAGEVEVNIKENVLRVEAKKEREKEKEEKGYYCKELSSGYYRRAVSLPAEVEDEEAEAELKDGILKITVPKEEREDEEPEKGTRVEVNEK